MPTENTAHSQVDRRTFPPKYVLDYQRFLYALIEGDIEWENVGEEDRIAALELHGRIFPAAVRAVAA